MKRELNLMVKYVTFNHCNMSSNLIALKNIEVSITVFRGLNKIKDGMGRMQAS